MILKLTVISSLMIGSAIMSGAFAQNDEDEQNFREMGAFLKANESERQDAISSCIAQGIGDNPTGAAKVLGVPVEEAATAWCTRTTNGIAEGTLTLADLMAANEGTITPQMLKVLRPDQ